MSRTKNILKNSIKLVFLTRINIYHTFDIIYHTARSRIKMKTIVCLALIIAAVLSMPTNDSLIAPVNVAYKLGYDWRNCLFRLS